MASSSRRFGSVYDRFDTNESRFDTHLKSIGYKLKSFRNRRRKISRFFKGLGTFGKFCSNGVMFTWLNVYHRINTYTAFLFVSFLFWKEILLRVTA